MNLKLSKKLLKQAAAEAARAAALGGQAATAGVKTIALGTCAAIDGLQEIVAPATRTAMDKMQRTACSLAKSAGNGLQAAGSTLAHSAGIGLQKTGRAVTHAAKTGLQISSGAVAHRATALLAKKPHLTAKHYMTIGAIAAGTVAVLGAAHIVWHQVICPTYLNFRTKYGRARVYQVEDDQGRPVRLLEVGGIVQSGTYLDEDTYTDLVFEYLKLYDLMFQAKRPIKRICVLGCGGYDYPEHLIAHHPGTIIDAVEIDPGITSIAERYFFLDRVIEEYGTEQSNRLNLICDDALDHLLHTNGTYDAIVNDTFDAGTPPKHLTTADFISSVRSKLAPGGIYLTNVVAPLQGRGSEFLTHQRDLLRDQFAFVYLFPCAQDDLTSPDNIIVAATDDPLPEEIAKNSLQLE